MVTDIEEEPSVAVNVHGVAAVTLPAVNSTWALSRPEPTVTEAGRGMALELELVRSTTAPPLGASPLRKT